MELPLFPLHLVLFPGSSIPLQVFEPRYRAMMDRVMSTDRRMGIVAIRLGMEVGGPAETHDVGCVAEVEQITRDRQGMMHLVVSGTDRFRIDRRLPDDPFPMAEVTILEEPPGDRPGEEMPPARAAIHRYLSVVAKLQGQDVVAPPMPDKPVTASFALAAALQLDVPERQRLLEAPDARARLVLATELAKKEALLLEAVGPSVGQPRGTHSLN